VLSAEAYAHRVRGGRHEKLIYVVFTPWRLATAVTVTPGSKVSLRRFLRTSHGLIAIDKEPREHYQLTPDESAYWSKQFS
jgi:hypothetical protein